MKKICFITLVIFIALTGKSQNYFETLISAEDGVFREGKMVVETGNHGFIVGCDAQFIYQNDMLVHLSSEGEVLGQLLFQIDGKNIKYCGLYHHPENADEYFAVAVLVSGENTVDYIQKDIALLVFDDDLNVLDQTIIDFGDKYLKLATANKDMPRLMLEDDGSITMTAHCQKTDGYCYMFARFTMDGQILKMVENASLSASTNFLFNAFSKRRSDGSFGMLLYDNQDEGGEVYYDVDALFSIKRVGRLTYRVLKVVPAPQGNHPDTTYYYNGIQGTVEYLNDSIFLASDSGRFLSYTIFGTFNFVAMLDDSLTVSNVNIWDIYQDQPNYINNILPARDKAISVTDDAIYHCGVMGIRDHGHYHTGSIAPSTITVSKFDRELNLIWRRHYCDNGNFYDINWIEATEDGGCIITGIYLQGHENNKFLSYILKVDETGYNATDENEFIIGKPYFCYPNPAKDNIYIEFSPDVQCQSVEIYDMKGNFVETFPETSLEQPIINITNLNAGVYIIKIRMTNGEEYTEQIIKE